MASIPILNVMPLETQGALFVSVLVATMCTLIEAVLAHTFSETIGISSIAEECECEEVKWVAQVVVEGPHTPQNTSGWATHRMSTLAPNTAPNTAYTMMQSVHSSNTQSSRTANIDKSNQNIDNKHNRRLDASNFLQSMQ